MLFALLVALEIEDSNSRIEVGEREYLISPPFGVATKQYYNQNYELPPKTLVKKPFDWLMDEQYHNLQVSCSSTPHDPALLFPNSSINLTVHRLDHVVARNSFRASTTRTCLTQKFKLLTLEPNISPFELQLLAQYYPWFLDTFEKMPKDGRETQWRQIAEHDRPEMLTLPDNLDDK